MSKTKGKIKLDPIEKIDDLINDLDQLEPWDLGDANDQAFWEEFFQIEDMLEETDELDPPQFTISVVNHQTGRVRTFDHIRLKSIRKKIVC